MRMITNKTEYYFGVQGSGKTTCLTRDLYKAYLNGKVILSNYPLNFSHIFFDSFEELEVKIEQLGDENIESRVGIDEIDKWAIARYYKKDINIKIGKSYGYTRKNLSDIVSTGHRLKNFDVLCRGITRYLTKCEMKINFTLDQSGYKVVYGDNYYSYWLKDYLKYAKMLEYNVILCTVYNVNGDYVTSYPVTDLVSIVKLFDTRFKPKTYV